MTALDDLTYLRGVAKFQGKVDAIPFVVDVLMLGGKYEEQVAVEIARRGEAVAKCIANGTHWTLSPEAITARVTEKKGGQPPRCSRCGARADMPHTEDPGLRYKAFQYLLSTYVLRGVKSVAPDADLLRSAGWDDEMDKFPKLPNRMIRRTWGVVFACFKHDERALRLVMERARRAGVLLL